jgi:hypothetical protein
MSKPSGSQLQQGLDQDSGTPCQINFGRRLCLVVANPAGTGDEDHAAVANGVHVAGVVAGGIPSRNAQTVSYPLARYRIS